MKKIIISIVLLTVLLVSCKSVNKETIGITTSNTSEPNEKSLSNPDESRKEGMENDSQNNRYIAETDDQPFYCGLKNVAATENGYYIMRNHYLYLYDKGVQDMTLLCGKPDCNHKIADCNANFFLFDNIVCYYNQSLYMIGSDWENKEDVCLYKVSLDGSSRKKLAFLYKLDELGEHGYGMDLIVHRGYAYCTASVSAKTIRKTSQSIYRVSLLDDKHEKEEIYKGEGYGLHAYVDMAYGEKIFFNYNDVEDTETEKLRTFQYYYDTAAEKVMEFKPDGSDMDGGVIAIDGDVAYYVNGDRLMSMDLATGEVNKINTTILSEDSMIIAYDNINFYFVNIVDSKTNPIIVMNKGGEIIDQIQADISFSDFWILFGDDRNLLILDEEKHELNIYDKTQLGNPHAEWKKVPYEAIQ